MLGVSGIFFSKKNYPFAHNNVIVNRQTDLIVSRTVITMVYITLDNITFLSLSRLPFEILFMVCYQWFPSPWRQPALLWSTHNLSSHNITFFISLTNFNKIHFSCTSVYDNRSGNFLKHFFARQIHLVVFLLVLVLPWQRAQLGVFTLSLFFFGFLTYHGTCTDFLTSLNFTRFS